MHDVLTNVPQLKIPCLDKGFVELVDVMPRLVPEDQKTADFAIVQAARVSYGSGTKTVNEDAGLIRYLQRHSHSTPTEMIVFKFNVKTPIFCARQIVRHRMCSMNEISGRYSILKDEFYFPEIFNLKEQSKTNKQGGETQIDETVANDFLDYLDKLCLHTYCEYEKHIEAGVSREQARMALPVNLYTNFYWKMDLHNLLHFLSLRCDAHAQWEVRVFANAMLDLIKPIVPITIQAWEDYNPMRGAIKLTRLEVEAINKALTGLKVGNLDSDNKRERQEWIEKALKLGLIVENV